MGNTLIGANESGNGLVRTPRGVVEVASPEEAEALLQTGAYCGAMRRLDRDRVQICTRGEHADGLHVDGVALILAQVGYIDGDAYAPVPPTAGPWYESPTRRARREAEARAERQTAAAAARDSRQTFTTLTLDLI